MDDWLDSEWQEWYSLSPLERWRESDKLWAFYLSVGGSLDPEPDSQSPFDALYPRSPVPALMGGQACVFYSAAEFSRDCDVGAAGPISFLI